MPLMSRPIFEVKSAIRTGAEVESLASSLAIALSKKAFSLTVGAKGPIWSNEATEGNETESRNRSVGWLETQRSR